MKRSEIQALATEYRYAIDALWHRHGPSAGGLETYTGGPLLEPSFLLDVVTAGPLKRRYSEQDLLDALVLVRAMRARLDHAEGAIVSRARRRGVTFRKIASAMGLKSRQAAEQRCLKLQTSSSEAERSHLAGRRLSRFGMTDPSSGTPVQWAIYSLPGVTREDVRPPDAAAAKRSSEREDIIE